MNDRFYGSWLKIQRAKEHIQELNLILKRFLDSDFYSVRIDQDGDGVNFLAIDLDTSEFPSDRCALIIGDAIHNLRSALDLFYYAVAVSPGEWSIFPITKTREKLESTLRDRLEKKQITSAFGQFIRDRVRPYEDGNGYLWSLHRMNNWDKHQLLIPVFQAVEFGNICLQDENQLPIQFAQFYSVPHSFRFRIDGYDGKRLTVTLKNDCHPTAQIFFNFGNPIQNQPVVQTLIWITEEVTRTIELFDLLSI